MWLVLVGAAAAASCEAYSGTDCGYCFSESKTDGLSCGFCLSPRNCWAGNISGPFDPDEKCDAGQWVYDAGDKACKADSSVALPTLTRILVGVFVAVIAFVTLFFWIWVFPRLYVLDPTSLLTVHE
jgi:hypothetical protein